MGNFKRSTWTILSLQLAAGALGLVSLPRYAHATAELDHRYALETLGALRSWDNVDGLFGDYVKTAYQEYFSHQSRFRFQDLSKVDSALMTAKIPYQKA